MLDWLRIGVTTIAVAAVLGGGGYLAVTKLGWERTLAFLGIQVEVVLEVPASQCHRAQDEAGRDQATACVPDRRWLASLLEECAAGEDTEHAFIDETGALRSIGKCSGQLQAAARAQAGTEIPRDYRVADLVSDFAP